MPSEALKEHHQDLTEKVSSLLMRQEVAQMESMLGQEGANLSRSVTESSRQATADYIQRESGWGPTGSSARIAQADDRYQGKYRPFFENEQDLQYIRGVGRFFANMDEAGIGIKANLVNYIAGAKIKYAFEPRERGKEAKLVQKLNEFLELFLEANSWCGLNEKEPMHESYQDGELLLALRVYDSQIPEVEILSADHLTEPEMEMQHFDQQLGETYLDWSFGVGTRPNRQQHAVGYYIEPYGQGDFEVIGSELVEHVKLNVPQDVKRGFSDYVPAFQNLERAGKGISHTALGATIQASIAFIKEHANGVGTGAGDPVTSPGSVSRAIQGLGGAYNAQVEKFMGGAVIDTGANTQYKYGPMGQPKGANLVEVFQAVLRRVAVRWSMPEWMISSDASNNNRASAEVGETAWTRATRTRQGFWAAHYESLIWKAVAFAIRVGGITGVPSEILELKRRVRLNIEMLDPAERDALQEEQRRAVLHQNKVLSKRTWATLSNLDYEQERDNIAEEPQEQPNEPFIGQEPTDDNGGPTGSKKPAGDEKGDEKKGGLDEASRLLAAAQLADLTQEQRAELAAEILYGGEDEIVTEETAGEQSE